MIFTPAQTAAIFAAITSIELGNNGHADIGTDEVIGDAVRAAGYTVIRTTNLHGAPVLRGFTKAAQKALAAGDGVSTYKPVSSSLDAPDYEGAILARNDRHLFA